jgi:hypothetical protein
MMMICPYRLSEFDSTVTKQGRRKEVVYPPWIIFKQKVWLRKLREFEETVLFADTTL